VGGGEDVFRVGRKLHVLAVVDVKTGFFLDVCGANKDILRTKWRCAPLRGS
jgi:hypothetical protein